MTLPQLIAHRIEIVSFRLEQRLKSEHATIRDAAREHALLAHLYRSLRDTPVERHNPVQQAFYAWFMALLPTYENNQRLNEVANTRDRLAAGAAREAHPAVMAWRQSIGQRERAA